jgi:hypothetical protein
MIMETDRPLKVGDPPPWPRMSEEVTAHLARQQPCRGSMPARTLMCQCGDSLLIVCGECGGPVLLFVDPDRPICSHAGPYVKED